MEDQKIKLKFFLCSPIYMLCLYLLRVCFCFCIVQMIKGQQKIL